MSTIAWFHCFSGIAGDMALGSLLDAGAEVGEVRTALEGLPFGGWTLEAQPVLRGGIAATRAVVSVSDDGVERTASQIAAMIATADLPDRVAARALAVFERLAKAESAIHRRPPSEVHFHELGGHDAIVDVVGTAVALELLGIDEIRASAVTVGRGTVTSRHGLLPNPAPAVVELLRGAPIAGKDLAVELTTPTGAAILVALATGFGPVPTFTVDATGYGAGSREIDGLPNCTQVVIGHVESNLGYSGHGGQPLALVECNLDDATGEQVADTLDALLAAGAADAWITPVLMKKGRPGQILSALCEFGRIGQIREVLITEGGSFGVRTHTVDRYATARRFETVTVDGHPVRMKINGVRAKVEHDDAAVAASALGVSVREITDRAAAAHVVSEPLSASSSETAHDGEGELS